MRIVLKNAGQSNAYCFACVHVDALKYAPIRLPHQETLVSNIERRQFLKLSAAAAAGCFVVTARSAGAEDLPKVSPDDPMAKAMRYTHDAASVDPATRGNPAAEQNCANCALIQGNDGDEWRPCQIFPGKVVAAAGWCSAWSPQG
jgi:hypothetical protein